MVLNIPELLEAILRAATPETQLVAYSVSIKWLDVATFVIAVTAKEAKYTDHCPFPPVEFCNHVDPLTSWNQPSGQELHDFELRLATARSMLRELPTQHTELVPIIFSARLS
jgi:hypothetical protein